MEGVVKPVPLPTCVVKAASLYHLMISVAAPLREAFNTRLPVPHLAAPVPIGAAGPALIVAVTVADVLAHPARLVSVI